MSKSDILKTALRLPRNLHKQIHAAADKSGRSMNAEIVHRLEDSFTQPKIEDGPVANVSPEQLSIAIALAKQISFSQEDIFDLMSLMKKFGTFAERLEKAQTTPDDNLNKEEEKKGTNLNPRIRKLFLDKD